MFVQFESTQSVTEILEAMPEPGKRGRSPQMAMENHETADKRRKQLREAQKTYRQRKAMKISDLNARAKELENGIENLSQAVLSFLDTILEDNMPADHPKVMNELHSLIQKCVSLAKRGYGDRDQLAHENASTETDNGDTTGNIVTVFGLKPIPQDAHLDAIEPVQTRPDPQTQLSASHFYSSFPHQESIQLPQTVSWTSELSIPSLSSPVPVYLPYSPHSFFKKGHGWAISHLIVKKCCEMAYRLLISTPMDVSKVKYIFGHELTPPERSRLISEVYHTMQDGMEDKVERKTNVLQSLRTEWQANFPKKLLHSFQTWNLRELNLDQWLDASDVEGFLQRRGLCNIDAQAPFALVARTFDLESFITTLSRDSICIGPGPVFLKQHVEAAVQVATVGSS